MNLQDVFTHLAHGELSNLFVGEAGYILTERYSQIASSVSLGLMDLYQRLLIKEGSTQVTLSQGTNSYLIPATDLIKVERIVNSTGEEITLNDLDDPEAFLLVGDTGFTVPDTYFTNNEIITEDVTVFYRAAHPELDATQVTTNPSLVPIELPLPYLPALLLFVASRVHTPIGLSAEFHQGNDYLSKYEAAVARLGLLGVPIDRESDEHSFHDKGWV